ncbi:MAG TPA: PSD1 and planctomycete cytochrome C domain-containing protein [Fimbriimonas sp.]|nr:PSD1 and planctomycete cytochrome C domain-containing protein [Fimbriimonas sp.]
MGADRPRHVASTGVVGGVMGKGASAKSWVKVGMVVGAATPFAFLSANQNSSVPQVSFGRQVAPVFKAHCISCHSGKSAAGKLDLSTATGMKKGGVSGALFKAGDPKDSLLMKRLMGIGGASMPMGMPPLSHEDLAMVRQWIEGGAKFDSETAMKHWAYVAPVMPKVPNLNSSWVRNPIDAFVLAKLKKEGLRPSPEASKETLIRRLSLDLIGLPPTPAEVSDFVHDKSPNAYEKVVDRLLASPHYGERQAREWLDLARYADTDGYEKDLNRTAWEYRDWVINAYNRNMPYDQFTVEQIAGDLMPNSTLQDKVATGFERNTMQNLEGGVNQEEAHFAVVEDRAETTATVWLGTTLMCARCHDHKYDPFTQKDYYKMVAFYNNSVVLPEGPKDIGEEKWLEPRIPIPTPTQEAEKQRLNGEIASLKSGIESSVGQADQRYKAWQVAALQPVTWDVMKPEKASAQNGATLKVADDGTITASGANPDRENYDLSLGTSKSELRGLRLEALTDPSFVNNGPGRADNGNFVLTNIELFADGKPVGLAVSKTDYTQSDFDADEALVGNKESGWAVNDGMGKPHEMAIAVSSPVPAGAKLRLVLEHQSRFAKHVLGKFRVSVTDAPDPLASLMPADVKALLKSTSRDKKQEDQLLAYFRSTSPFYGAKMREVKRAERELSDLNNQIPMAMVLQEKPTKGPLTEWVRHRGEFTSKTDEVNAGTPSVLPPLKTARADRLDLAKWLVSKNNPLTARVEVNRIWERYFGRGIVETSEDFGTRGTPPTHPELLDWLACEFMAKGWDMKAVNRMIVMSSTYRQSSDATPTLLARDPQNLLLARGPRFRMEAEMIHDVALQASGLLSPKIGGPSVFPYQPDGIWDSPYSGQRWMPSTNGDQYRRGIYTFWKRTAPYPSFEAFDATSRESCTVRRIRTNTPLQALAQLNDKFIMLASQALAKKMETAGKTTETHIDEGFVRCVARKPKPAEVKRLEALYAQLKSVYAKRPKEAAKLGGTADDAAWTMLANVLLNLDETITKG